MGDESTWGQLRYLLNAVDDNGSGRVDAWRFDWDSRLVSSKRTWFETSAGNLERSINAVKQLTGQAAVNLVGHSFGGIVIRAYIQGSAIDSSGTTIPFQNDVTRVMTIGTPHRGIGGDYATFLANACLVLPPDRQPDTCYEADTGAPQVSGEGSFLAQLNTLPLPSSLANFTIIRGQTLDLGGLVLNQDDGVITSIGDDFCSADPAISCGSGIVTNQPPIASSISDKVGLCHASLLGVVCASGLNVAMAQVDDKTHPLWQEICEFLGGDPTKCKPQLKVTISPASPPGGVVTSDANDPGIDCGTSCAAAYDVGTNVTLTATPLSGFAFSGWSGDCSGTSPCIVTMNGDKTVTANFVGQSKAVITVGKYGGNGYIPGTGTITSSPSGLNCDEACTSQSAEFPIGTVVTITATPAQGSVVDALIGNGFSPCSSVFKRSESSIETTVTVQSDSECDADFNQGYMYFIAGTAMDASFTAQGYFQVLLNGLGLYGSGQHPGMYSIAPIGPFIANVGDTLEVQLFSQFQGNCLSVTPISLYHATNGNTEPLLPSGYDNGCNGVPLDQTFVVSVH
jgi:hypothetical protein